MREVLHTKCTVYWQVSSITGGGRVNTVPGRRGERKRDRKRERWVHLDGHGGTAANQTISGFWINLCTVAC